MRWLGLTGLVALAALLGLRPAQAADAPRDANGLVAVPPLARVTDLAGLLQPAQRASLDEKLAAFESARGTQIAIVIVPSAQPEPIADFAQRIGDAWKIGRKGVGDGVLIAVTLQPRGIWISVARSLEGALPDVVASRIAREVIGPRFRQDDFAGGLAAGLDALFRRIEGEGLPAPDRLSAQVEWGDRVMALLPVVLVGVVAVSLLRSLFGAPGALLAAGGAGSVAGFMLASLKLGVIVAVIVFVLSLRAGGRVGRVVGSRRGRGIDVLPGGFGGGWGGGSSGGWSSGGGGDFAGGGGGSDW